MKYLSASVRRGCAAISTYSQDIQIMNLYFDNPMMIEQLFLFDTDTLVGFST